MINFHPEDFYETLVELGERVTFENDYGEPIVQYAALTSNRANKSIATAEGSYLFIGNMTFDDVEQQEKLLGRYFSREAQPRPKYILAAVFPESSTEKVATIQCIECNETIDILSHYEVTGKNEYGEDIKTPIYLHTNVPAYMSEFTKEAKNVNVGALDRTIAYITFPASLTVSTQNRIVRTSFVYNAETHKNEIKRIPYRVEGVDTSMTEIIDGEIVGIVKCLVTEAQDDELNI